LKNISPIQDAFDQSTLAEIHFLGPNPPVGLNRRRV
jgi:hypothetical protein